MAALTEVGLIPPSSGLSQSTSALRVRQTMIAGLSWPQLRGSSFRPEREVWDCWKQVGGIFHPQKPGRSQPAPTPKPIPAMLPMLLLLCYLALIIFVIAGLWKVFTKAGQPGWAAIIPIYNLFIMLKIAGRPAWWLLLFLIPLVNIVIAILVAIDVAKAFGKGAGFGLGLVFLGFIFYPILGFGSATYKAPAATT